MAFGLRFPGLTSANPEDDAALSPAMLAFLRGQQQDAGTPPAPQAGALADTPTLTGQGGPGQPWIPFGFNAPPAPRGAGDGFGVTPPASRDAPAFGSMAGAGGQGAAALSPSPSSPPASSTSSNQSGTSSPFSLAGFPRPASTPLRRSVIDPVTGNAQLSADALAAAPDPNEVVERGLVLPIGRTRTGQTVLASQGPVHALGKAIEGLPDAPQQAADAIGFFGDVAAGRKGVFDPSTGHVSDEAMGAAGTAAGLAMTGSIPFGVPAGALRTFGGRAAATADHAALDQAAAMQAAGASPEAIWQGTGWGLGRDGVARFEIPDDGARLRPHDGAPNTTLGSVLDHPALFDAYPQLRDVSVFHRPELGSNAAANPSKNWIAANLDDPQALPSLLHEGQHIVQRTEGFAPGASPIDPALAAHPQVAEVAALRQRLAGIDNPQAMALADRADQSARMGAYRTAAGEVEARNVEARQAMTPTERAATPPWQTQDVPAERQWLPPQSQGAAVTGDAAHMKLGAEPSLDDLLASMQSQIDEFAMTPPPPGPRRVDPTAPSWDLYHGSTPGEDFARFDPTKANNPAEQAVFFAPSADTASDYAGFPRAGAEAGSRVFRTTVEPGKTGVFDLTHLAETDPAFNARAREITMQDAGATYGPSHDDYMSDFRARREQDRDIARQAAEMGFTANPDHTANVSFGWGHIGAAVERAKAQGLDTAILRNLAEHGGDDQVIALTPGRVRSYYDPDHVLYSGGPGGAGIGASAMAAAAGYGSDAKAAPPPPGDSIPDRFVSTLRDGGLTNPNGLAAVAAYAQHESRYSPSNITGSWSDPSQSGQAGTSGGILSWRADRLKAMREFTAGAADPVVAQAKFTLAENPALTRALQNAKTPQEANALMADAWKFAGYDKPGGGEYAARLATTLGFADRLAKGQTMQLPGGSSAPGRFGLSGPTQAPFGSGGPAAPDTSSNIAGMSNIDAILAQMGAGGGAGSGKGGLGLASGSSGSSGSDGPKPPAAPAPLQRRPFGFMTFAGQTPRKGTHSKTPTRGSAS